MATLRNRNGTWRVEFFIRGVRTSRTLGKVTREEAEAFAAEYERTHKYGQRASPLARAEIGEAIPWQKLNRLFDRTKRRAADRKIEFLLRREELDELATRSFGMCEITHIKFDGQYKPAGSSTRPWAMSIDRIESGKPYTKDNCRLVCVAVNMALGQWGLGVLLNIAEAIVFRRAAAFEAPKV